MKILKVKLSSSGNPEILINQNQICWITKHDVDGEELSNVVLLHMGNGEVLYTLSPTWEEWEGDLYNG